MPQTQGKGRGEVTSYWRPRLAADETGQVILFALIAMVALVAMVGFVVDVGHAYLVQRQLQSGVDAAALAGAQHLPEPGPTTQVAMDYGPSPGKRNAVTANDNAQTTVTMRCVQAAPGCSSTFDTYNAVHVRATSDVKTVFARVIGFDKFTVTASATACSPCSAKALDIMLVLDRSGSMCKTRNGSDDHPQCTDMNNAKAGMRDVPELHGPGRSTGSVLQSSRRRSTATACARSRRSPLKRCGYDTWWPEWIAGPGDQTPGVYAIGSLTDDYAVPQGGGWALNPASSLLQLIDCVAGERGHVVRQRARRGAARAR